MSYYITVKQSPFFHQMTLEELIFGTDTQSYVINSNSTNTRTYQREEISDKFYTKYNYPKFTREINSLFEEYKDVYDCEDLHQFYHTFHIPKKSHGFRQIDAPMGRLKEAQYKLRDIINRFMCCDQQGIWFGATYHTAAFAYVTHRCPKNCIERHQKNKSRWFAKFDFSNFFGSTTMEFVMKQLGTIMPFALSSSVMLRKALKIAFLDGGLPQGTPLSPMITNIMMIPIDFELQNILRNYNKQSYVYTRYADDILVSSEYDFRFREIEDVIRGVLAKFQAPFNIKPEKTRYGSSAGSNWNLGMMLNKDGQITVGHKKKRYLKAALTNYIQDRKNGTAWELNDVQVLNGELAYCRNIEGEPIDKIVQTLSAKFQRDILRQIKADLKGVPYEAFGTYYF